MAQQEQDKEFNADAKTAALLDRPVTVSGIVYRPRKKTGAVVKALIELAPEDEPDDDDRQGQLDAIDTLYKQVALLLADEHDNQPDPDRLSEELDMEVARDMIRFLMPSGDGDDEKGGGKGNVVALRS